jgi:hypothetical protein
MFEALEAMETGSRDWGVEAQALAEMWRRVSRQHLSSGQGCACGFGGGLMLQGAAFELDIVEFLIDDARKAGLGGVETFIDAVAKRSVDQYSLIALIDGLGRVDPAKSLTIIERAFAINRLRTTLVSMDSAHTGGRFACD